MMFQINCCKRQGTKKATITEIHINDTNYSKGKTTSKEENICGRIIEEKKVKENKTRKKK
jgi:hypothetical protein